MDPRTFPGTASLRWTSGTGDVVLPSLFEPHYWPHSWLHDNANLLDLLRGGGFRSKPCHSCLYVPRRSYASDPQCHALPCPDFPAIHCCNSLSEKVAGTPAVHTAMAEDRRRHCGCLRSRQLPPFRRSGGRRRTAATRREVLP